jgi:endonuclease III
MVCKKLQRDYGTPRLGNPANPLDDLIYIIISNRTLSVVAHRVYEEIKKHFKSWDEVILSKSILRKFLEPAGLSALKSKQIVDLLVRIRSDFGRCELDALRGRNEAEVEAYLTSLPGD